MPLLVRAAAYCLSLDDDGSGSGSGRLESSQSDERAKPGSPLTSLTTRAPRLDSMLPLQQQGATATPGSGSHPSTPSSSTLPAATAAAHGSAGAKRPAASDLQVTAGGATPSNKRQATSPPSTAPSRPAAAPTNTAPSPSARPVSRHHNHQNQNRHAPPASPAAQPAMSVSTTTAVPVLPIPSAAMLHPPLTEDQLHGKSHDQLVHAVLQLQSQHQHYVAHISAQYDNISQQLSELRSSLLAFYSGQAACHQAAASV